MRSEVKCEMTALEMNSRNDQEVGLRLTHMDIRGYEYNASD